MSSLSSSLKLAKLCVELALDKKALDPVILDLRKIEGPTYFFVIVSAESEPQLKAISTHLEKEIKEQLEISPRIDGFPSSKWVVIDYGDVMVQLFLHERRDFYGLEALWKDAPRVKI
ncbi:MAG: ribosome silencing factor [Verrucomicrobiota bacterium]